MSSSLVRVAPFNYIHILDNNRNTQRVEVGPQTFTRQDHETIVLGPVPMVIIPPRHYCVIRDPYIREDEVTKVPKVDQHGQVELKHGDKEIRFAEDWKEPFALLPGERLVGTVTEVLVVQIDTALRLIARRDLEDEKGEKRVAGDEWLFYGPATYRPRVEQDVVETITSTIIKHDHSLKLQARNAFTDRSGKVRKAGEEWLIKEVGAFLPSVDEVVIDVVAPHFLFQTRALHLRATDGFVDAFAKKRRAGEEWLVTRDMSERHLQDVFEELVGTVALTTLTILQYGVVLDPVGEDGKNQFGSTELRRGPCSFFLLPGESLDGGIQRVFVLGAQEALLLKASEAFDDATGEKVIHRTPGDRWMISGPCDYVPPVEVEVIETRESIPLDETEGIYVRNIQTGKVRSVKGETYMLLSYEELWKKELSDEVEQLLTWTYMDSQKGSVGRKKRDKTRIITYKAPHNACVQIYDYKTKKSRVVFGPGLVMLDPDEQFTVVSLSGDKPKKPNVIKSLSLMLGPDFMTDIIEVETSDHARLRLKLSYNWQFLVDKGDEEAGRRIFQVRDFVGDACKAIASRVRGAVAAVPFDAFHKGSAQMIRTSVFGVDPETQKIRNQFIFNSNNLAITNIDIQSAEPVDEKTRESLQKSVQLAIEITTRKQERNARHDAEKIEQDAKGLIERQRIENLKGTEVEKQNLIQLQAACAAIATTGTAKAEAEAKAEYLEIEGKSDVKQAQLSVEASNIEATADLAETTIEQIVDTTHKKALAQLDLHKSKALSDIEAWKFKALVEAIGPDTIKEIARAGPEMQARLLKGLGLTGYLMTDGNTPVNLFKTAKGMVTPGMPGAGIPTQ